MLMLDKICSLILGFALYLKNHNAVEEEKWYKVEYYFKMIPGKEKISVGGIKISPEEFTGKVLN